MVPADSPFAPQPLEPSEKERVRQAVQEKVGAHRFGMWFARARFERSGTALVVTAAESFVLDSSRRYCGAELLEVAVDLYGTEAKVEYRLLAEDQGGPALESVVGPDAAEADSSGAAIPMAEGPRVAANAACSVGSAAAPTNGAVARPKLAVATVARGDASRSADAAALSTTSPGSADARSANGASSKTNSAAGRTRRYAKFEEFVVGPPNRLAWASAQMACEQPGQMSPLVLYGPVGVGKTHLMESIRSDLRQRSPRAQVIYLTAEKFTNEFVASVQGGLPSFRRRYRGVDVLLLDDIQFFCGKRATLIELLYTINTLINDGKQIVLAGDRPLQQLGELGPELVSRLMGGMVCPLEPADYAMRRSLLQRWAAGADLDMPAEVMDFVAEHCSGSVRLLQGALNRLQASSMAWERPIDLGLARDALGDLVRAAQSPVQLPQLEQAVCEVFGLTPDRLRGGGRARTITQPRMLLMWLARKYTRSAYTEISRYLGHRSHSSVISAEKKVEAWRKSQRSLETASGPCSVDEALQQIERHLNAG